MTTIHPDEDPMGVAGVVLPDVPHWDDADGVNHASDCAHWVDEQCDCETGKECR
jgi:hypothetical protein